MHETISIGDTVYVLNNITEDIQEAKVESQEWWKDNLSHPVYYNLVDVFGNELTTQLTGNWHFQDVFTTRKDAEDNLMALLNCGFKYNMARARLGMPPLED